MGSEMSRTGRQPSHTFFHRHDPSDRLFFGDLIVPSAHVA
jgi:hypothetical protein